MNPTSPVESASVPPQVRSLPEGSAPGEARTVEIIPGLKVNFQWIPAGTFQPSAPAATRPLPFAPLAVTLPDGFWLATTECTIGQWNAVMRSLPKERRVRYRDDDEQFPVEGVSWLDCQEFLRKLTPPGTGWRFDLPSEWQWEFACRANSPPPPDSKYVYGEPRVVGSDPANPWGLHDLFGGVAEWCRDVAGAEPFLISRDTPGRPVGQLRVTRGGEGTAPTTERRANARRPEGYAVRRYGLGFRLAMVKDTVPESSNTNHR